MGTSLKIMDLELDLLTEETLCKKMAEYLSGDLFRVVHLVSLDCIRRGRPCSAGGKSDS